MEQQYAHRMISSRRWTCFWRGQQRSQGFQRSPVFCNVDHCILPAFERSRLCMSDRAQRWRPCAWHPAVSPSRNGPWLCGPPRTNRLGLDWTFEGIRQGASDYFGIRCLGTNDGPIVVFSLEGEFRALVLGSTCSRSRM